MKKIVMPHMAVIGILALILCLTVISCSGANKVKKVSSAVELYECDDDAAAMVREQLPAEVREMLTEGYAAVIGEALPKDTAEINSMLEPIAALMPDSVIMKWGSLLGYGNTLSLYALKVPAAMSGAIVENASAEPYIEHKFKTIIETPQILLTFTPEAAAQFAELTTHSQGKGIAIVVNGNLLSAPRVNCPIDGGKIAITGYFTQEETEKLAEEIMASAVPVDNIPAHN